MRYLLIIVIVTLIGCVSPVAKLTPHLSLDNQEKVNIEDKRDVKKLRGEFLSNLITSCDYGVERLGEDRTEPLRLELLADVLSSKYGNMFSGKSVKVYSFDVYSNRAIIFRHIAFGSAGVQGELMKLATEPFFDDCALDSSLGAYTKEEVTTPYSPIIILFDVEYDKQRVQTRTVFSPEEEFMGQYNSPDGADALYRAIETAIDDMVLELGAVTAQSTK
ncbi:hypothetical protein [Veronia pacifica]|uniref:Lipoprotein n=1 Tax=Veronia pacifica TaxID=1080227 RepID=A0A1C3ERU2_9GAMM|nr:hypothetical protein [Veronia pacifica]ODA35967.1 hypothetical protein A8L45_02770 [Veronia pacifica]